MTHRIMGGVLSLLVFVSLVSCRDDAKPNAQQSSASPAATSTVVEHQAIPAEVVKRYYDAIGTGHYDSAYALWEDSGKSSGQTRAQFETGFAQTLRTTLAIGDSVHIEAAAGSQYATVPVIVEAVLRDGKRQHFAGAYVLRRAMVDGATPEQRTWHIYSAHLTQH